MLKPLQSLEDNTIKLEIMENGDFIRTGTPMDGNCYYHSIFLPFKYYRDYNVDRKKNYIEEKKKLFFNTFDLEDWLNNEKSMETIFDLFRIVVYDGSLEDEIFSKYEINEKNYKILCDLIGTEIFDEKIIKRFETYKEKILECDSQLSMMKVYLSQIIKEEILYEINEIEKNMKQDELIANENKTKIIDILINNYLKVFQYIVDYSFQNFKENNESWLDIHYFSNFNRLNDLEMNIFFIDATTGYPYKHIQEYEIDETKPFVVVLYFPDYHFETIGKKVNNKLYRVFNYDDPFIQKIINYIESH